MIALITTNIILAVAIGIVGIALFAEIAKDTHPIVIKEAKALREYYEEKLKNMKEQFLFSNFVKQINIEALGIQSDALEGIDTSQPMNEEKLSAIFRLIDE